MLLTFSRPKKKYSLGLDQYIGLLKGIPVSTAKEPYFHGPTKHVINSRFNFSQFPDAIILNGFAVTLIIHQATHSR